MSKKVPVQKGPIVADQPNYKFITPEARALEDAMHNRQRRSGQTLTLHEPKPKRK